jgi:hypothetical protein
MKESLFTFPNEKTIKKALGPGYKRFTLVMGRGLGSLESTLRGRSPGAAEQHQDDEKGGIGKSRERGFASRFDFSHGHQLNYSNYSSDFLNKRLR